MNILTDRLPDTVLVDGSLYPVYTDFRVWITFELLMLDGSIPLEDKAVKLLTLCYVKKLPQTMELAIAALIGFYSGDKQRNDSEGSSNSQKPIYSFEHDADYIYAAFLGQYNMNLQAVDLHWWQFKALFKSLNDTNQIIKIMEYRSVDLAKIKDKGQKAFYRKMKSLYKLPDFRSEEEKEKAMVDGLSVLF